MPFAWTPEILSTKIKGDIETLRENANAKGAQEIVAMCDAELARRKPPKANRGIQEITDRTGQYVREFHFVCPNESEVTKDQSGIARTGTWVVAESHAANAVQYGALIGLHASKAEPSYLQGQIIGWKRRDRVPRNADGELVGTASGIEFEFRQTPEPLSWRGDGAGEKGYDWADIPDKDS